MTFKEFQDMFEAFTGELFLYISGSQGVSSNYMKIIYNQDFSSLEDIINIFCEFIDENAYENIDDYLEDCDYDENEAMGEAVADSGEFYLGTSLDNLTHVYCGIILEREEYEL